MRRRVMQWVLMAGFAALPLAGCGDSNDDGGGGGNGTTTMVGTLAGATETGTLTIDVPLGNLAAPPAPAGSPVEPSSSAPVDVTGTLHIAGGSDIPLTGLYDRSTHIFGATAGGYTLGGNFSGGAIDGTYTGPNGPGGFSLETGSANNIMVICGSYSGDDNGSPDFGMFNMVLKANNSGRVLVVDNTGGSGVLSVTRSGSNLSVFIPGQPSAVIATGTLSGTSADGDYDDGQGAVGTWSGTSADCQ